MEMSAEVKKHKGPHIEKDSERERETRAEK